MKTQGGKRYCDLHRPALSVAFARGDPGSIPREIDVAPFIRYQSVLLSAQRIDSEPKTVATVVIGVEHNFDFVVIRKIGIPDKFASVDL